MDIEFSTVQTTNKILIILFSRTYDFGLNLSASLYFVDSHVFDSTLRTNFSKRPSPLTHSRFVVQSTKFRIQRTELYTLV